MSEIKTLLRNRLIPGVLALAFLAGLLSLSACSKHAPGLDGGKNDCSIGIQKDTEEDDWDKDTDDPFDWDDDPGYTADTGYEEILETAPEIAFPVEDLSEPLEIDTYDDYELLGTRYLSIYDADYLDLFFGPEPITVQQITGHIDGNDKIPGQYKKLLTTFVTSISEKYPDADLRPLDYNIKTLEIVECDEFELALHTLSLDAYGCYVNSENRIYVPEDYTYLPQTWEYQVIMHEFGHCARTVLRTEGDTELTIDLSSKYYEIPEEALNSVFTVSLFDYEERDIAYQLQSNMFLILLDCCEDYTLSDYLNHSLTYFAHKLDEKNGNNNYALQIMQLMEAQRYDGINDDYERPQEVYYPIYDYLTKMYLDKYGSADMSDSEIDALVDRMLEIVLFDVPEEYHIDTEEFHRFAQTYFK